MAKVTNTKIKRGNKIMDFKKDFPAFRADFQKAMEALNAKYEVEIKLGNISYDGTGFTSKISCKKADNDEDYAQIEFEKYCAAFGFESSHYNQKFIANGQTFALVGFNPNAPKNGCVLRGEDGKPYRCPTKQVKEAFKQYGLIKE